MKNEIEKEVAACSTHPRVTRGQMEAEITLKAFTTAYEAVPDEDHDLYDGLGLNALETMTICILVLRSGFTVVATAAPASPENFDFEIGKKIAYENAIQQLWPHFGFYLKQRMADGEPWPPQSMLPRTAEVLTESDIPF